MPSPTRFSSGVTNRGTRHLLSSLPILDPSKIFSWFDDFAGYTIGTATTAGWFSTAATGTVAAQVTGANGLVAQTPQAAAAAFATTQWGVGAGTASTFLRPTFGKKFWMSTRFKVAFGAQNNQFIGATTSTVNPYGVDPANKIAFRSLNATPGALQLVMGPSAGTIITVPLGTTLDNTFSQCNAYYDGKQTLNAQRLLDDGTVVAAGSADVGVAGSFFPTVDLAPIFASQTKDGAASSVQTLDYIFFASER